MLTTITDLGDSALLLPASVALSFYLWARGSRSPACWFVAAMLVCVVLTALAKIGLSACAGNTFLLDLRSPSGHAALGATFYLCAALLLTVDAPQLARAVTLAVAAILGALIAGSRVLL